MAPIISVVGYIAAGKSTYVKQLSSTTNIPYLAIDQLHGDWSRFERIATHYRGSIITESVAMPIWHDLLIYCHCDEHVRQLRLEGRDAPREPLRKYDYGERADLIVNTTGELDLAPSLRLIRVLHSM